MEIILATIATSITFISSYLLQLFAQRRKIKRQELVLKMKESYSPLIDKLSIAYVEDIKERSEQLKIEETKSKNYIQDARTAYKNVLRNMIAHTSTYDTEKEIEVKIETKLNDIQNRMNQIENRFPADSSLDKIASINDAILAKSIETISESIKNIEKKLLSKWDVAKVFFQILTALGVLISIILAVKEFVIK